MGLRTISGERVAPRIYQLWAEECSTTEGEGPAPLLLEAAVFPPEGDLRVPRAPLLLFESTKSEMRGTISERNRVPLKTP